MPRTNNLKEYYMNDGELVRFIEWEDSNGAPGQMREGVVTPFEVVPNDPMLAQMTIIGTQKGRSAMNFKLRHEDGRIFWCGLSAFQGMLHLGIQNNAVTAVWRVW